jgi:hypothetical protein
VTFGGSLVGKLTVNLSAANDAAKLDLMKNLTNAIARFLLGTPMARSVPKNRWKLVLFPGRRPWRRFSGVCEGAALRLQRPARLFRRTEQDLPAPGLPTSGPWASAGRSRRSPFFEPGYFLDGTVWRGAESLLPVPRSLGRGKAAQQERRVSRRLRLAGVENSCIHLSRCMRLNH